METADPVRHRQGRGHARDVEQLRLVVPADHHPPLIHDANLGREDMDPKFPDLSAAGRFVRPAGDANVRTMIERHRVDSRTSHGSADPDLNPPRVEYRRVSAGSWVSAWLMNRWPTWLAIALVFLTGFDVDDGREFAFIVTLSGLAYVIAIVLNRRWAAWVVVVAGVGVVNLVRFLGVDEDMVLLGVASLSIVWAVLLGRRRPPRLLWPQVAAMIILGVTAALAVSLDPQIGGSLVAAGLIGHAVWDAAHHRADKVVTRSYAEWCGVVDLLLGVFVLVAVL
jgi:hypothetical protein